MRHMIKTVLFIPILVLLAACEQRSSDELLSSIDGKTTPAEVEAAIGSPDKVTAMGTTEIWLYETTSQDVCFIVAGETIIRLSCV